MTIMRDRSAQTLCCSIHDYMRVLRESLSPSGRVLYHQWKKGCAVQMSECISILYRTLNTSKLEECLGHLP
jgi:hypothetical protein